MDNVLSAGCSVDGTATSNPVLGVAEKLFDVLGYTNNHARMQSSVTSAINSEDILQGDSYTTMLNQFQSTSLNVPINSSTHGMATSHQQSMDPYMAMQAQTQQVQVFKYSIIV
jgi:hypothetical protein